MARYYYRRYKSKKKYTQHYDSRQYVWRYERLPDGDVYQCGYISQTFDSDAIDKGIIVDEEKGVQPSGNAKYCPENDYLDIGSGDGTYLLIHDDVTVYTFNGGGRVCSPYTFKHGIYNPYLVARYTWGMSYVRGDYVEELIAEEGDYPDGARNEADGYWYEKGELAPQFYVRVNGEWKGAVSYARVNGVWVEANPEALTGGSVFTIDENGNAALSCTLTVDAACDGVASCGVNVYHGGFAEV